MAAPPIAPTAADLALADHLRASLAGEALAMALAQRRPAAGLVYGSPVTAWRAHVPATSDRGDLSGRLVEHSRQANGRTTMTVSYVRCED